MLLVVAGLTPSDESSAATIAPPARGAVGAFIPVWERIRPDMTTAEVTGLMGGKPDQLGVFAFGRDQVEYYWYRAARVQTFFSDGKVIRVFRLEPAK
jgi:hypothetical protein